MIHCGFRSSAKFIQCGRHVDVKVAAEQVSRIKFHGGHLAALIVAVHVTAGAICEDACTAHAERARFGIVAADEYSVNAYWGTHSACFRHREQASCGRLCDGQEHEDEKRHFDGKENQTGRNGIHA